jgi:uncharacterized membrane protein
LQPATVTLGYSLAVNGTGVTAGMAIGADGSGHAYIQANGLLTDLGQPAGGDWSSVYSLNAYGAAAGTAMDASGNFRGFTVAANGTVRLLGPLGGANSYAQSINDSGVAAGNAQLASGAMRATEWNSGTATNLGALGGMNSYAAAINNSGQVVGSADLPGDGGLAAVLFNSGSAYNLNGLLLPGSGWQLLAANGINNAGQIIGRGIYGGVEQAFLLTPQALAAETQPNALAVPEPSAFWLAAAALFALVYFRSRRV